MISRAAPGLFRNIRRASESRASSRMGSATIATVVLMAMAAI